MHAIAPERTCNNTGPACRVFCEPREYDDHQGCGACDTYLMCQDGTTYHVSCPPLSV